MKVLPNQPQALEVSCVSKPNSVEDVDPECYYLANPDVKKACLDAKDHFIRYGQNEGRVQWLSNDVVSEIRERKLQKIKFKKTPLDNRKYGECANFVSKETLDSFDISAEPPVSSNQYSKELNEEFRNNPDKLFLDIGAGLRISVFSNVVNTEIYPSISTDIVCIGEDLPFEDNQFDKIICFAVLEHTKRPWEVAREICRVLKPGGEVLIDYPFLQPVHGYPHHYFNATPKGNQSLFETFCDIESVVVKPYQSPIFSLCWFLNEWNNGLPENNRAEFQDLTIRDILKKHPGQHLDQFYCDNLSKDAQSIIAAGSFLTARKKVES